MAQALATAPAPQALKRTPLYDLHVSLGAKMVPFAGYEMPVQYPAGIIKEHLHTRSKAGLFDISHMGQVVLESTEEEIRLQCEKIMPGEFQELAPGQIRYSFLLNEKGGVLDDLMVTRPRVANEQNSVFIIINAACKDEDFAHMKEHLPDVKAQLLEDRALLALQGPDAAKVLARFCDAAQLPFMFSGKYYIKDVGLCFISRSGYTGEDGFEISVPGGAADKFARELLEQPEVAPVGLGARDSLRLEAGLCLYGHELDTETTPVEASLLWAIGKRRRQQGGFIGAEKIQKQLAEGVARKRVGIKPEGRVLAREQTQITDTGGKPIGIVTSGGFGPSVDGPVCMGYVETAHAKAGTAVQLMVRGKPVPAKIVPLPFVPHRYFKG